MIFVSHRILGLIGACWVYYDARKRGRDNKSALLWSLGVLVEIIIFLPLYLFLGRKPRSKPVGAIEDGNIIDVSAIEVEEAVKCPMCAGKVKEDFKLCPYCGYTLQPKCGSWRR